MFLYDLKCFTNLFIVFTILVQTYEIIGSTIDQTTCNDHENILMNSIKKVHIQDLVEKKVNNEVSNRDTVSLIVNQYNKDRVYAKYVSV